MATPVPTTAPAAQAVPAAPAGSGSGGVEWTHYPDCSSIAEVHDVQPGIDGDRISMDGEITIGPGGPVKDLQICLSGSCRSLAPGRVLQPRASVHFSLAVQKGRPSGLIVRCSVPATP